MRRRNITSAFALLAFTLLSGCDSQRLSQFSAFATAGSLYVTTFHQVITQAGSAMIAADSATLITARIDADGNVQANPAKYRQDVVADDQLLQANLATLQLIDEHATLLGSYFNAISNLTNGKAATGVSTAATDLLNSISDFNPKIANAQIGGQTVQSLVQPATSLVVTHFEVKALDDQLAKAAPIIGSALFCRPPRLNSSLPR